MFFVDYHTHSRCSPDSTAPLAEMAAAAYSLGVAELCTTDHCDLQQEDGTALDCWDWTPILEQYEQTKASCQRPDFRLLLGLELGGAHTNVALAKEILSTAPLDFVIGSVHNLSPGAGGQDMYFLKYEDEAACHRALADYFASLLALAPLPVYDCLGHITYPFRYINGREGYQIGLERYLEPLDQLLRTVIDTGRAIELNTHGGREIKQWLPVLKRYHDLGGELITLGSDAHKPAQVAKGLPQSVELLRETGFRWLTVYRQRKPEQIKL